MKEKDLVKKIKKLQIIEPRKDWVLFTKNRIFQEAPVIEFKPRHSFGFFLKPAFVFSAALFLVGGAVFYFSNLNNLQTAQVEMEQLKADLAQMKNLTLSLDQLQANISLARENLELMKTGNLRMVLEIKKSVDITAESGKRILDETKKIVEATSSQQTAEKEEMEENKNKVLASLVATEEALDKLKLSYEEKVKKTVEYLIEDIEHWSLGEEDSVKFENAKEYYREGEYGQALEEILLLGGN
jgi:TolA-binding protein